MTASKLAETLGVSRQLLAAHRKKPAAPKSLNDVAAWTLYFAQHGRIGSAPDDLRRAIAQERLEILRETKLRLARENQESAKALMPVADAKRQNGEAWAFVFSEIDKLANEAPPGLAGQDAVTIHKRLIAWRESFRKAGQNKFEEAA